MSFLVQSFRNDRLRDSRVGIGTPFRFVHVIADPLTPLSAVVDVVARALPPSAAGGVLFRFLRRPAASNLGDQYGCVPLCMRYNS